MINVKKTTVLTTLLFIAMSAMLSSVCARDPAPALTLQKTGPAIASPGETITYHIYFDNYFAESVNNVILVDTLPSETTYVSSPLGGTYDAVAHTVTWNFGTLAPGAITEFDFTVTVKPDTTPGSIITNVATLDSDETLAVTALWDILIPPVQVIPEVPLGTVVASAAMIVALIAYVAVPKWRRKQIQANKQPPLFSENIVSVH